MGDTTISLEAGGRRLHITPQIDRAKPVDANDDIVEAQVDVDAGTFRGAFRTFLWPGELESLRSILSDLHESVGDTTERTFRTFENEVQMVFRPSHLGALEIEVETTPSAAFGPFLHFFMEADQSYLPAWIASLDTVIRQWPKRAGAPKG